MTNKLEISRELLEAYIASTRGYDDSSLREQLCALLAQAEMWNPHPAEAHLASLLIVLGSAGIKVSGGTHGDPWTVGAPVVERQEAAKISIDRPWKDYPLGTKAVAVGGGHWVKNINGWKWFCGSTFPTPGGDARWVILPEDEQPAPVAVVLPEFEPAFEAWWESDGQYCRAGGGSYEKTFAYRAYEAAIDKVKELNQ